MAIDSQTQQILDEAGKLGDLVATHPAVAKYKAAQKGVAEDTDANRLMTEFNRQLETLARQEQSGMPITDAQRQQLESIQARIASNLKVKALNLAEFEFTDLLRKVSQTWQKPLAAGAEPAGAVALPSPAADARRNPRRACPARRRAEQGFLPSGPGPPRRTLWTVSASSCSLRF